MDQQSKNAETPTGGRRNRQQQNPSQARIQQRHPQQQNDVLSERLDAMIYGYLRRHGRNNTADAFALESPNIDSSDAPWNPSRSRPYLINDTLHDRNIEQVIQMFFRDGHFGIHQSMLDFGEELQRLASRYRSLTHNLQPPNTSSLHQQLYGRSAFSRHQQPQNYSVQPAPQAIAQMGHQRMNQVAEHRYRQEQIQKNEAMVQSDQTSTSSQYQSVVIQQNPTLPQQDEFHPHQQHVSAGAFEGEESPPRSARRKLVHPQNINSRVQNVVAPLVDHINDRVNMPLDDSLNLMDAMNFDLDSNFDFINALSYTGTGHGNERQRYDAEVLENVLQTTEQYDPAGSIMVIHEEIVEAEIEEEVVEQDNPNSVLQYHPAPAPLMSPLPANLGFRQEQRNNLVHQSTSTVFRQSTVLNQSNMTLKKEDIPLPSDGRRDDKRDQKSGDSSSRSTRSSSSPPRRHRSPDEIRKHDNERGDKREKERSQERNSTREQVRDREKRRDERKEKHANTSNYRRSPNEFDSSQVQSDRESTSSTSSRATNPDRKDAEREKKRKEKELQQEKERRTKEKEREREDKRKPFLDRMTTSHMGGMRNNNATNLLNTIKTTMKQIEHNQHSSSPGSTSGGSVKRKGGDVDLSKNFKIPKKSQSSTPSDDQHQQSGGFRSREASISSLKSEGKSTKRSPPQETTSDGAERDDATRFLKPQGHLARPKKPAVSSILHNCDTTYKEFHDGLQKHDNPLRKMIRSCSPSSSARNNSSISTTTGTFQLSPNPKGRQFAPIKGPRKPAEMGHEDSEDDTSEENLSDELPTKSKYRSESRSESPDSDKSKKSLDFKQQKLMDKLHGRK